MVFIILFAKEYNMKNKINLLDKIMSDLIRQFQSRFKQRILDQT